MSKPRPIHTMHRDLRSTPDENEPSFSYEQESFLGSQEEDAEDEFHRRLANNRRESGGPYSGSNKGGSSAVNNNNSNNNGAGNGVTKNQSSNRSVSEGASNGKGPGSFWRTDVGGPNWQGPSFSSMNIKNPKDAGIVNERKTSGGLLGAALQLHSQSERTIMDTPEPETRFRRSNSSSLPHQSSIGSIKDKKKDAKKQRMEARRLKMDAQSSEVDIGHLEVPGETSTPNQFSQESVGPSKSITAAMSDNHSMASTASEGSGGLLYGKGGIHGHQARASGMLFGKSSSLIFPTGAESSDNSQSEINSQKRQKINLLLDQCETVRFPFKKKLILSDLNLTANDIPVKDLYGTSLGNTLHKLSLSGNRLATIPPKLVICLPVLKNLDLSQCELHQLPDKWNLPQLKRLNLSHNRLTEFPEESILEGLLELQDLNMYGNKVAEIIVPHNPNLLTKLEVLNLGYNDLAYIPDDLDRLKALRTLKVMNNFLEKVPIRVCDMDLKTIDVSSNPVIQPPIDTCERGICAMKRYYHCLRLEEQSKQKALEAVQSKSQRSKKSAKSTKKVMASVEKVVLGFKKPKFIMQTSLARKSSDESENAQSKSSSVNDKHANGGTNNPNMASSSSILNSSKGRLDVDGAVHLSAPTTEKLPGIKSSTESTLPPKSNTRPLEGVERDKSVATVSSNNSSESATDDLRDFMDQDKVTVNDTLKVIFVGMAMAGKTSMITRLIEGKDAVIPKRDERTVGVDIYEWDPKTDHRFEHIDSRIEIQDKELVETCGDVDVKFSVWDFAGQHVYHATHELFFSNRALYVVVWDMGAKNPATMRQKNETENDHGAFKLSYDSSDDENDEDDFASEEEIRRADRALERDIDEKVQFWVDCIQSSAPGAAILPVASFNDLFPEDSHQEAKRRCNVMKQRLLKHEQRRIQGIKDRLKEFVDQNRANDEGAMRLRKLLCSYTRPKLIFGNDDDNSVVRVSGKEYSGFADLTERIINISTGRDKCNQRYPIFRGHVGARIPRMRLEVREVVRSMRDRFKVVEWGYFLNQLRDKGLTSAEDISDALHFLTNIGEVSYFGGVLPDRETLGKAPGVEDNGGFREPIEGFHDDNDEVMSEDEDDYDDRNAFFSMDGTSVTASTSVDGSLTTSDGDFLSLGLSQFVFLNPRWLVAAVACILRHDLDREIEETRRLLSGEQRLRRGESFYEANLNCPVITADDACMLWQAKKFTKKAAERAEAYSNDMTLKPFEFLQLLLTRFGVFVPIDLSIEKAFLGGKEYARQIEPGTEDTEQADEAPKEIVVDRTAHGTQPSAKYFFLPSLLGPGEPAEAWTYKSTDSWKGTLCHSILFPDGVPPGLMERITAKVLSNIYAISSRQESPKFEGIDGKPIPAHEGNISVKEVLCWRTAFFVKLGMKVGSQNGQDKESIVEAFAGLVDRDSHLCVGSDYLGVGMRRLVTSAKGQIGDGGRNIWKGGYLLVCRAVQRVMEEYGGLEYEKQGVCPECLAKMPVSAASCWDSTVIRAAVQNGEFNMRCRHGHRVDTRLVAGPVEGLQQPRPEPLSSSKFQTEAPVVPINDLLRGVVVVGLWDGNTRKVVRVGSGFIADKKRGLIVTASHTLMNIWGDKSTPFGENYYGLRQGKVVIGVIPRQKDEDGSEIVGTMAVFRYFAKIVAKDPSMDKGECHLDACILRITTRMENDVGGSGEGCGDQPERLLLNNPQALKQEKMHQLKITEKTELDEQVRIIGYNQGGEGLLGPGESLNRYVDFARGYVCKLFTGGQDTNNNGNRHRFKPHKEVVVICPTIGGHSGGPCVNQQGEVIGILSRADPAENQRCYLVPTVEWKGLLKEARNIF